MPINFTSNGDLRRKQGNHKMDESVKISQSVEFFCLFLLETLLYQKKNLYYKKKIFDQKFFWPNNQKIILVKNIFD